MKTSEYSGFYKLSVEDRLNEVKEFANLDETATEAISNPETLNLDLADHMIENVIGRFSLPMGVALNYNINGKDYVIPMVTEEPSVIAAASNAARIARSGGGFKASYITSNMIAQVQITDVDNPEFVKAIIYDHKDEIIEKCNSVDPTLVKLGGGVKDIEVKVLEQGPQTFVVMHLIVNTLDAMGANAVNTMAESIAPFIEEITGGTVYLRILSNLATKRLVKARVKVEKEALGGEDVVDKLIVAYQFAKADPYRAATHNKGIMNGISAVVLATGNDTRAIESGAHAYAALSGQYGPLTTWEKDSEGNLVGTLEMPMAVGLVGGATKSHPTAQAAVKILGVQTANELGEVIAALGLGQNLAALRVLATEGVQRGHMSLHARNVAIQAGAPADKVDEIAKQMVADKKVNAEYAKELLNK